MLFVLLAMGCLWGALCRGIAVKKRRSGFAWFAVGFLFGLIGLIAAAAMSPLPDPNAQDFDAFG